MKRLSLVLLFGLYFGCGIDPCGNDEVGRVASPDGKFEAVIFQRDCGATTDFSTQISILSKGGVLPKTGGNVWVADSNHGAAPRGKWGGPSVEVRWSTNRKLSVVTHPAARISRNESAVTVSGETVQVEYSMTQDATEADRRDRARKIQESIRAVLLHDWDPIGIQDEPGAQDEYDSYVGAVYRLLTSRASEEQIVEHLWLIETMAHFGSMGTSLPRKAGPKARERWYRKAVALKATGLARMNRLLADESPKHTPQNRETAESKLRRSRKVCPVCLAVLRKNAKATKRMKTCVSCEAHPSTGKLCSRCSAEAIWENNAAAACQGCGTHGRKRGVIANS